MSTKFSPTAVWRMRASPGPGLANLNFLPDQNFGPAGFVKADGVRHGITPQGGMTKTERSRRSHPGRVTAILQYARKGRGGTPSERHPGLVWSPSLPDEPILGMDTGNHHTDTGVLW